MKKTSLPSLSITKFCVNPGGETEVNEPVQSLFTMYVAVKAGKLTTPLTTAVPLPARAPFPSETTRFTCAKGSPLRVPV